MAVNNVVAQRALQLLRRALRDSNDYAHNAVAMLSNGDPELADILRPHAQAYRNGVQAAIASATAAIQATNVTNADKVAFANAELGKDAQ